MDWFLYDIGLRHERVKWIRFFVFQIKMKNEKQTSDLNFSVQLF